MITLLLRRVIDGVRKLPRKKREREKEEKYYLKAEESGKKMLTEMWIQVKLNHPADSKLECWAFLNWSVRALPIYYRITTLSSADKTLPLTVILPKKMNAAIILKRKGSFLMFMQKKKKLGCCLSIQKLYQHNFNMPKICPYLISKMVSLCIIVRHCWFIV